MDRVKLARHAVITETRNSIRIGWHGGITIAHPRTAIRQLLRLLDGKSTPTELGQLVAMTETEIDDLLARLAAAGLLESAKAKYSVYVFGEPLMALALIEQLGNFEIGVRIAPELFRIRPDLNQVSIGSAQPGQLVIFAAPTVEPDFALLTRFQDHPVLHIRCSQAGTIVGPLVQPHQTACLRCIDLRLTRQDAGWAAHRLQLSRQVSIPGDQDLAWASNLAVHEAISFLRSGSATLLGTTASRDSVTNRLEIRSWAPHPGCQCAA